MDFRFLTINCLIRRHGFGYASSFIATGCYLQCSPSRLFLFLDTLRPDIAGGVRWKGRPIGRPLLWLGGGCPV